MTQPMHLQLETERLTLRRLRMADVGEWFAIRTHPDVARFQPWRMASLDETSAYVRALDALVVDTPGTWFQLAIQRGTGHATQPGDDVRGCPPATSHMIGDVGIRFQAEDVRQVELGITLDPSAWGHGYAAEALRAVLDYLFGMLGKHRVFASTDPRNQRCIALLSGLGMRQEAHFRESYWFQGEWTDDLVFGILDREWRGPQARSHHSRR